MDVSTNQLRTFVTVARLLNFSRAAEVLYISQPAVSIQVRKLERQIGIPLFEQIGRSIFLTPGGQLLCRYAERVLTLFEEFSDDLAELQRVCQGPLKVGAIATIGVSVLPGLLRQFTVEYPQVTLRVLIANEPEVAHHVLEGQLDLGIITDSYQEPRLKSVPLRQDELVVVVSPEHRWAELSFIEPWQLADEPLIIRGRGSPVRARVEQALASAGVTMNVVAEMNNNEAIIRSVEAGLGITIISNYAIAAELAGRRIRQLRIAGVPLRCSFNLVTLEAKHATPNVRAFQEMLMKVDWDMVQGDRVRKSRLLPYQDA